MKKVTILDPTCGSGAFLFAAMNILEELYEVCLDKMQLYTEQNPQTNTNHLKKELAPLIFETHPNKRYFIYKSIILNNLYGVDIMNEAVEIAKLRLFLKLVACVDPDLNHPNQGLEPLPDIDFNIRCGNTLVGYANWDEIENDLTSDAISAAESKDIIQDLCETVAMTFIRYKEVQLEGYGNYQEFATARKDLLASLADLTDRLDRMLHQHSSSIPYDQWKLSYQPFHWFAEFYEIVRDNSGFEIIIGNPPYVEYNRNKFDYFVDGYKTLSCGNLYAFIYEKSVMLILNTGRLSLIIPSSCVCTKRMLALKELILEKTQCWISFYGNRPATLFSGSQQNLAIIISKKNKEGAQNWSTKHRRWSVIERDDLFSLISYISNSEAEHYSRYGDDIHKNIMFKVSSYPGKINYLRTSNFAVYYSNSAGYWIHSTTYIENPECSRDNVLKVRSEKEQVLLCSILNSSLFYLIFSSISDLYHVTLKEINFITVPPSYNWHTFANIIALIEKSLFSNMKLIEKKEKTGLCLQEEFYPKLSKDLIDLVDKRLASVYSLTNVELDFTINYDIKYRMGKSSDDS